MRKLDAEAATLAPAARDEIAEQLWEIALMVEEGDLASALEALRRAQDRLDEAIRNGASQDEIEQLMQEMRQALDNYMRELAEEAQRNPDQQQAENRQTMEMSGDQLQEMLDKLQELMEQGRMAEAAELMEMMRQLMENMQVTMGEGQGQGPGSQAMRDLSETLRDQQGLSDDAFRELQQGPNGGRPQDGRPGEGEGQEGRDGRSLAERQRELGDRLNGMQNQPLPGQGSERGENGRRSLDDAGRAMREAERALRDGDLPGASTGRPRRWSSCARGCASWARPWPRSSASRTVRARARPSGARIRTASAILWGASPARPAGSDPTATCCRARMSTAALRISWTRSAAVRATSRAPRSSANISAGCSTCIERAAATLPSSRGSAAHGTPSRGPEGNRGAVVSRDPAPPGRSPCRCEGSLALSARALPEAHPALTGVSRQRASSRRSAAVRSSRSKARRASSTAVT